MLLTINKTSEGHWTSDDTDRSYSVHHARLAGSLDEHTVSQLRELSSIVFDGEGFSEGDHFLIDLNNVTEIDDLGFAALIGTIVVLASKAGSLGLILSVGHPIRHAFQVTGIDRVFEIHETAEAADKIILELRRIQISEEQ
jgi:anti-anti-sigma factor